MERISLPVRTVSKTPWVAAVVGSVAISAAMLWSADSLLVSRSDQLFSNWRTIISTRDNIKVQQSGGLVVQGQALITLFSEEGPDGLRHAAQPAAWRALTLDSWDGAKRYLYARGFWRDANSKVGDPTEGGAVRADQVTGAVRYLREAVRREPMNSCYRQTLAEVLLAADASGNGPEALRLIADAPPQNAWGQMRAAELLDDLTTTNREDLSRRLLTYYLRSLELTAVEFQSGIMDLRGLETGAGTLAAKGDRIARNDVEAKIDPGTGPLGDHIVRFDVEDLIKSFGKYSTGLWSGSAAFKSLPPRVHYQVALALGDKGDLEGAKQELEAVVTSAQERYTASPRTSSLSFFLDVIFPFMKPDPTRQYETAEDLNLAATVLREQLRMPDKALGFYRIVVARHPGWVPGHVGLAQALVDAAALATEQADRLATTDKAAAEKLRADARASRAEADREISIAFSLEPKNASALAVRAAMVNPRGGAPTP